MKRLLLLFLICTIAVPVAGQKRRDPLTPAEVDQLRENAQEPHKRLKLFTQFAKARLIAIEQLRGDPKLAKERGKQLHSLIEDFDFIANELSDNLDMYDRQRHDLRKPLKEIIEGYTDWQLRLRTLKEAYVADPKMLDEYKQVEFVLDSAIDTVNAGLEDSRAVMDDHVARYEKDKKKK